MARARQLPHAVGRSSSRGTSRRERAQPPAIAKDTIRGSWGTRLGNIPAHHVAQQSRKMSDLLR